MTTCDGWTHNVRVGSVVGLLDNHPYRVLKITPPSGPVALKRTTHSTYRSFLRAPSQLSIIAHRMVNRSTQIDPQPTDTDDPLARDILQGCSPAAVEAYHQGRIYCVGDIHWIALAKPIHSHQP